MNLKHNKKGFGILLVGIILIIACLLLGALVILINAGFVSNIPVGLQVMCDSFKEDVMFSFLKGVEDEASK